MNNYDRMLVLAGLEPIMEASKAKGPPKKYKATYDGKTIEIMAADASEAKQKAVDVKGLSVPMSQWGKVSVELAEGAVNDNMSRYGLKDPTEVNQSAARLFGLYVGLRGSGELHIQFTGDRAECLSQWHDDLKRDYKRGEAVARVVPVHDNAPNVIAESFECEDSEDIVMEAEADEAKVEDNAPVLDTKAENVTLTVKVPADVTAAITSRIAELKQSIAQYNDKGYDDGGVKPNAIDALEQIAADLKLEDGLTKANIFYGTLMSPITDLFPPKVVKFLHTKPEKNPVKEGYNQDFGQNDQEGHARLNAILKRLDDKLEFANPSDAKSQEAVASWVHSNVGKAFWDSVADFLDEKGYDDAASQLREYSYESGY